MKELVSGVCRSKVLSAERKNSRGCLPDVPGVPEWCLQQRERSKSPSDLGERSLCRYYISVIRLESATCLCLLGTRWLSPRFCLVRFDVKKQCRALILFHR